MQRELPLAGLIISVFTGWVQSRSSFAGAESAEPNRLRVWEAAHLLAAGIRTQVPYLFSLGVVTCNAEMRGEQC